MVVVSVIMLLLLLVKPVGAQVGGRAGVKNFTGGIGMTGNRTSGADQISSISVNGMVNALTWGITCGGGTDNNPSTTGPLQSAINAAAQQALAIPGTGIVQFPASCNVNMPLKFSTGITIPSNVRLVGLGGSCWDGTAMPCVEMDYSGASVAVTSTTTKGIGIENIRFRNTGTGTIGIKLDGTFRARLQGVSVEGFSQQGIVLSDLTATAESNQVEQSSVYGNGNAALLDGTLAANHAVANNLFLNDNLWGSIGSALGNANVVLSSYPVAVGLAGYQNTYDNMFLDNDISGSNNNTQIGVISNATLNTEFKGGTAENLLVLLQLNAGTTNFVYNGEAGINGPSTSTNPAPAVINAAGDVTYEVCAAYIGGTGNTECRSNRPRREGYLEATGLQDPTGQVGLGKLTNLAIWSEDFSQTAWFKPTGTTATVNAAANPFGATTASNLTFTAGTNPFVQGAYGQGAGNVIDGECFVGSVWAQVVPGTGGPLTLRNLAQIYDANGVNLTAGISAQMINTNWKRVWVHGQAAMGNGTTSVLWRPFYISYAAPAAVSVNLWGAQLQKVACFDIPSGPGPYVKTTSATITNPLVGLVTSALEFSGGPTALGASGTATLGTVGGSGPGAAAQNSWIKVYDNTGTAVFIPAWK